MARNRVFSENIARWRETWFFRELIEVQTIYPQAEAVGNFTIFNIKGNKYRLWDV
ncbi:MAG: type II toxin-antitoxin system HigB family toxin [Microcoleus sp.]